ncbi:MAG: PKD domain-containing protein [Candidatus Bathyarchaeota archaeon]|nr:PKD domain-containing protein [Candidatus Bathyarchaeota archaeon]
MLLFTALLFGAALNATCVNALANEPPVAVLPSQTYVVNEYEYTTIVFDGSGSYDPEGNDLHYRWDIGNTGVWTPWSTIPSINATWRFISDTAVTVTLKVSDGLLEDTETTIFPIDVQSVPPAVNAGDDEDTHVGVPVNFQGTAYDPSGGPLTILWDFGDGGSANGTKTPTHTYYATGQYTVTLNVTDNDGLSAIDQLNVTVYPTQVVQTCDSAGTPKTSFDLRTLEAVYITGAMLPPNAELPLYIVNHVDTWTNGTPLSAFVWRSGLIVNTSPTGTIPITMIWEPTLQTGDYDIFVDVNNNQVYDEATDIVITLHFDRPAAFLVTPEGPLGALLSLSTCIAAFCLFFAYKKKQLPFSKTKNPA